MISTTVDAAAATVTEEAKPEEKAEETLVLRLRSQQHDGPRVTWAEGVIGEFTFCCPRPV